MDLIGRQPEVRTKMSSADTISRQAAIEVIDAILPVEPMKNEYTQGITCGAALAMEYIKQLPSAQLETITCNQCVYYQQNHHYCEFLDTEFSPSDYCSMAERREK